MNDKEKNFLPKLKQTTSRIIYTDNAFDFLPESDCVLIVDKNVLNFNPQLRLYRYIEFDATEEKKTFAEVERICCRLLELESGRETEIVGIGGGITCDIAGFVSAIYKRGTPLTLIPTTLLAQSDAALGGKNGLNFCGIKNIIGTIRQPSKIVIARNVRQTLDNELVRNGLVEIIKTAAVCDAELFGFLENAVVTDLFDPVSDVLQNAVETASADKLRIVKDDQFESGKRRILNFGHTFGHAFEAYLHIPHGYSVAVGIKVAMKIAEKEYGVPKETGNRINAVLNKIGIDEIRLPKPENIVKFLSEDKKRESDYFNFVIVTEIGKAETRQIKISELYEKYADLCKHQID